jgi:hypothetical protein
VTYRILCAGRGFYFEPAAASRPIVVTRRGQPAPQPSTRHPFWRAVALWNGQGRRMSADGLCVWDETRRSRERRSDLATAGLKHRSSAGVPAAA